MASGELREKLFPGLLQPVKEGDAVGAAMQKKVLAKMYSRTMKSLAFQLSSRLWSVLRQATLSVGGDDNDTPYMHLPPTELAFFDLRNKRVGMTMVVRHSSVTPSAVRLIVEYHGDTEGLFRSAAASLVGLFPEVEQFLAYNILTTEPVDTDLWWATRDAFLDILYGATPSLVCVVTTSAGLPNPERKYIGLATNCEWEDLPDPFV
jgi:hypothetical protein